MDHGRGARARARGSEGLSQDKHGLREKLVCARHPREYVWQKVSRNVSSFMFCDFPEDWDGFHLWKMFKRYGEIVDLYIPLKRLRSGSRFGFVRFRGTNNTEWFLRKLNTIQIGTTHIRAFMALDRNKNNGKGNRGRPTNGTQGRWMDNRGDVNGGLRDERSYRDAMLSGIQKGMGARLEIGKQTAGNKGSYLEEVPDENIPGNRVMDIIISKERCDILKNCVIGEVKKVEYLELLPTICTAEGFSANSIKYLGGLEIMFLFENVQAAENLINNVNHGLRQWIWKLKLWEEPYKPAGRLTWLSIFGVPMHCWYEEVFSKIAERWGPVMELANCSFEDAQSLVAGKVLIQTLSARSVEENLVIRVDNISYPIRIAEDLKDIINMELEKGNDVCSDEEDSVAGFSVEQVPVDEGEDENHTPAEFEGGNSREMVADRTLPNDGGVGIKSWGMHMHSGDHMEMVADRGIDNKSWEINMHRGDHKAYNGKQKGDFQYTGSDAEFSNNKHQPINDIHVNREVGPDENGNSIGLVEETLFSPNMEAMLVGSGVKETPGPGMEDVNENCGPAYEHEVTKQAILGSVAMDSEINRLQRYSLSKNKTPSYGRSRMIRRSNSWKGRMSFKMIKDLARRRNLQNEKTESTSRAGKGRCKRNGSNAELKEGLEKMKGIDIKGGSKTSSGTHSVNIEKSQRFMEIGETLGFVNDKIKADGEGVHV